MKYDIVLSPSLKKNWIHYDVEIHKEGGNKDCDSHIGIAYSQYIYNSPDYPAFMPDVESDLIKTFNDKINSSKLLYRQFYTLEKIDDLKNNINSITIRNPIYYCLKSKLVWQNIEDGENTTFSEKLIEIKEYVMGSDVKVAECQMDSKINYDEGGSVEIKRKTIQKIERYYDMYAKNEMKFKEFKDYCYYNLIGIIEQNTSKIL